MRPGLLLFSLLLLCVACARERNTRHIGYAMKKFRVESTGGCKGDTTRCASFEANYPAFTNLDSTATKTLRDKMGAVVASALERRSPSGTLEEVGKKFVKDYDSLHARFPELNEPWYSKTDIRVERVEDSLLSLSVATQHFTGGAHASNHLDFINLIPVNGKRATLNTFLKPGYMKDLMETAERVFRKNHNLSDTASFAYHGYIFPGNTFQLSPSYGFLEEGILFYYREDELGPNVTQPVRVLVPYRSIKSKLKD